MRYITKSIRYDLYITLIEWCGENKFNYCLEKALRKLCDFCVDYAKWKLDIESKLMAAGDEKMKMKLIAEELKRLANEYEIVVKE
ncbi:MAG: hypothetical protein LM568_03130, partial [Desulfurococcaceae archaeon]|nr:hypothetical protein [Desulfurococcaceae archaeon]